MLQVLRVIAVPNWHFVASQQGSVNQSYEADLFFEQFQIANLTSISQFIRMGNMVRPSITHGHGGGRVLLPPS